MSGDSVDRLKVCICGGGNGAHMMTGLASSNANKPDVRVLVLYQEEAKTWTEKLGADPLVILRHHNDDSVEEIKGKPSIITKDPSKAVVGADIIIFCVPAFAHQQYFEAIEPHVSSNTIIVGLPGQAGFEFQCYSVLKDKAKQCVVLNFETLPWPCRIEEYGRKVNQLGQKEYLIGARVTGKNYKNDGKDPIKLLQSLLGEFPALKEAHSYLEILLMTKGFFHPSIMYGQWKDWKDTDAPLEEAPLFYQGLTEKAAECLDKISEEIKKVSKKVSEVKPELKMDNVDTVFEWVVATYGPSIEDKGSLLTAFRTNGAYKGLLHPVVKKDDGVLPDFKYRYMAEDVPFAMTVEKGVAQLAGVDTPVLDEVLTWAQGKLGKEYLVGNELKGKDVKETRAPQAFGFHKLDDLLALV